MIDISESELLPQATNLSPIQLTVNLRDEYCALRNFGTLEDGSLCMIDSRYCEQRKDLAAMKNQRFRSVIPKHACDDPHHDTLSIIIEKQ